MLLAAALIATTQQATKSYEVFFSTHDKYEMRGKLVMPDTPGPHPVVIYMQTAEGMTVDMKRAGGKDGSFNYFDVYRKNFPEMGVGFYSYDGRGIEMGDQPPRYEKIDRAVYDTSTIENKVLDAISALASIRGRADVDRNRIYLMGASEGTLIAAEVASTVPDLFAGLVLYGVLTSNMRYDFAYIMSDGAYMTYRQAFDANGDALVSKAEFEADPFKYRANTLRGAEFSVFDKDGDGFFTLEEMKLLTQPYLDALKNDNFALLDQWAASAAAVATPKNWFKDHFAQGSLWSYLSTLDLPIGFFQGDMDTSVPIEGVKMLEAKAKAAGKTKMEFHYFTGFGHSLGIERYFYDGTVPPGHQAIFEFVRRVSR